MCFFSFKEDCTTPNSIIFSSMAISFFVLQSLAPNLRNFFMRQGTFYKHVGSRIFCVLVGAVDILFWKGGLDCGRWMFRDEIEMFKEEVALVFREFLLKTNANPLRRLFGLFFPERRRAHLGAKRLQEAAHRMIHSYRAALDNSNNIDNKNRNDTECLLYLIDFSPDSTH